MPIFQAKLKKQPILDLSFLVCCLALFQVGTAAPAQAQPSDTDSQAPSLQSAPSIQGEIKEEVELETLKNDSLVEPQATTTNTTSREGAYSKKLFIQGEKALRERRYETAAQFLNMSLKELYRSHDRSHLQDIELAKAQLDLALQQNERALNVLSKLERSLGKSEEASSLTTGIIQSELAEAELRLGKLDNADRHIRAALASIKKSASKSGTLPPSNELGKAKARMAKVLARRGLSEEAREYFRDAVDLMEKSPGYKGLDLADVLREEAQFFRNIGLRKQAAQIFDKAAKIKDEASHPQKTTELAGQVDYVWEAGAPHSHEIIDQDFPLRYIQVNNIRVATTVIDLWELAGLLICVTNVDEHRHILGLGQVHFYKVKRDAATGQVKTYEEIPQVDHRLIDRIRRERNMWDLTQNRPWLANIQKTRNFRGLVPPSGHDLFRGPNVFGVWGEWPGVSHVVPTRVSILPSRENVFYDDEQEEGTKEGGLIRSEGIRQMGLVPINMEPLESRTGELFYLYPRDEDVEVRVTVGNTKFSFPFHCRKRRIN